MAETKDDTVLLVNPGGRVVAVTAAHAEQLLASEEGFKPAPEGAKEGDATDEYVEPPKAQNDLVPEGSSEEEAKRVADLQGTPENVIKNRAEDPTNLDVVPVDNDSETVENSTDEETNTTADPAGPAGAGTQTPPADDGAKAGRFFGRGKKK